MKKPQQRRKTELEIPNKNPLLSFQKSLNCDEKYRALPQYYLRTLKLNFVSKTKILSLILFYFFFNSEKKTIILKLIFELNSINFHKFFLDYLIMKIVIF
jgi:hypothetical protein